jgi:hypothetical protein
VSEDEFGGAPKTRRTHYLWWICAVVGINGLMALLVIKELLHTTGVCMGLNRSCNAFFLAAASSRLLHIIVESFIWAAADAVLVMAWVSHRQERQRLKRLAKVLAGRSQESDTVVTA